MTTYRKNPTDYTAVQLTDFNELTALFDLGCSLANDPNNQLVIIIDEQQIPIPLNGWVVKPTSPWRDETAFEVYTDEEFQARFAAQPPA